MDGQRGRVVSVGMLQGRRSSRSLALKFRRRSCCSCRRCRIRQRRMSRPHIRGRREKGGAQILCFKKEEKEKFNQMHFNRKESKRKLFQSLSDGSKLHSCERWGRSYSTKRMSFSFSPLRVTKERHRRRAPKGLLCV